MTEPQAPHFATLKALLGWLRAERIPCVLVGGVAASLLARPRSTRDVDVLIDVAENRWERLLQSGIKHGFVSRVRDPFAFAHTNRVLAVRHEPTGIEVDLVIAGVPLERAIIRRRRSKTVAGLKLPLPTPEDLLIMKAIARRARDVADMEAIFAAAPRLDRKRVRTWVVAFAEAMEAPELVSELDALFARYPAGPRR